MTERISSEPEESGTRTLLREHLMRADKKGIDWFVAIQTAILILTFLGVILTHVRGQGASDAEIAQLQQKQDQVLLKLESITAGQQSTQNQVRDLEIRFEYEVKSLREADERNAEKCSRLPTLDKYVSKLLAYHEGEALPERR